MSRNCPCAGITVTITKFIPVAFEKTPLVYCEATVLLVSTAGGLVSQPDTDDSIRVDRGAVVDLVFEAVKPKDTTDTYTYYPVGVSFVGQVGNLGLESFPTRTVQADPFNRLHLSVHDSNLLGDNFEYKLVIQRSDGALGVIDPQIKNG